MPFLNGIRNNLTKTATVLLSSLVLAGPFSTQQTEMCVWEYAYPTCNDGSVLNGYWWRDIAWVPMYPSLDSWFTPAPIYFTGGAVFYAINVMEANAEVRGLNLSGYVDGVALMSPADISLPVWLKIPNGKWEGPFLVVDSSMRGDVYPIVINRNEAIEVGWKTAKRWGMVNEKGQVNLWIMENVEISKINPIYLTGSATDYKKWWLDHLKPANYRDLGSPIYISPSTWSINDVWLTFHSPDPQNNQYSLNGRN